MDAKKYHASETERKWQEKWAEAGLYHTDLSNHAKKFYCLVMFPYPSGDKLHIGHWYNFGGADSYARFMRMQGYNVFEPIGFDAFGLPAENYAIKTGTPPPESTEKNCDYMRKQLRALGTMYDWSKEVVTSTPDYYKWTQWVFLQLYKKGLAYRAEAPVNFCPSCQTVLANEQVLDGACERCSTKVVQKKLQQWFFKITDYADDLLRHDGLDWPEKTILMQKNWIGRKEGINITYSIKDSDTTLVCFTTRPETNFGATFVVISPEHPLVASITTPEHVAEVQKYVGAAKNKTELERTGTDRTKTGVFTGNYAVNDLTGYEMPIYVADYVLMGFGTGVVVGVPGHDLRDFEFAQTMGLEVIRVIQSADGDTGPIDCAEKVFEDEGEIINSEFLNGLHPHDAIPKMMDYMEKKGMGKRAISYRLRDWLISRQRYWGAPIPIVYCKKCGEVPVPFSELPVKLPIKEVDYKPKGKSPLASVPSFVETKCPQCGIKAQREVDTMDTFMCSSWYFLRYLSPHDDSQAFDTKIVKKWMPVDMYIGGPEHACMHLLYARFIHKALMDDRTAEPFQRLVHQGLVTYKGTKMSKSKGNVVSPDAFVEKYGSDVFRMYLMFMGPFTEGGDWNDKGIMGIVRFVDRLYELLSGDLTDEDDADIRIGLARTIKKVTHDIANLRFNTALAALMEFTNLALKSGLSQKAAQTLVQLLAPLSPHLSEELWKLLGGKFSIFDQGWPEFDEALTRSCEIELVVQVNGKVRGRIIVDADISKEDALSQAREIENVQKYLVDAQVKNEIFVPGKLVNFVV